MSYNIGLRMSNPNHGTNRVLWYVASDVSRRDGRVVLALRGRFGYAAAGALTAALTDAFDEKTNEVIIDFSSVDYISGGGAAPLAALAARLADTGVSMILCGLQEPVRQVLSYAGLLPHVVVESTVTAALERSAPAAEERH